jgi:hypothetical protein
MHTLPSIDALITAAGGFILGCWFAELTDAPTSRVVRFIVSISTFVLCTLHLSGAI